MKFFANIYYFFLFKNHDVQCVLQIRNGILVRPLYITTFIDIGISNVRTDKISVTPFAALSSAVMAIFWKRLSTERVNRYAIPGYKYEYFRTHIERLYF